MDLPLKRSRLPRDTRLALAVVLAVVLAGLIALTPLIQYLLVRAVPQAAGVVPSLNASNRVAFVAL
ncbi:MAG: hypothetical protein AVDCRST_MAG93-8010 [uncultured Chloroflexia bacterium]|uniref:Uncharacterized protein n=1 Tax=uncultured Chloroflexia bacterium TaxID=1672391 RepID=A0A6J4MT20_9CHLR|nr:MAG: hypothetical protein AVDCRST_MAG93-8010 [uncultured Chloroflexia bacterium]